MAKQIKIIKRVLADIKRTIGSEAPERGGVLGAGKDGVISEYFFDRNEACNRRYYAPDIETINKVLADNWMPRGILMVGIVHSHDGGNTVPSCGDVNYAVRILKALSTVDSFYIPIVTVSGSSVNFDCYVVEREAADYVCRKINCVVIYNIAKIRRKKTWRISCWYRARLISAHSRRSTTTATQTSPIAPSMKG